jgi:hypothetical protein
LRQTLLFKLAGQQIIPAVPADADIFYLLAALRTTNFA